MSSSETSRKRARQSSVTFSPDCKQFDGLSDRSRVLEHLVHRLFFEKIAVSELYVSDLVGGSSHRALALLEDFHELVWRMKRGICEDNQPSFLLLTRGGGHNLRLVREHFPFVLLLGRVVEAAFNRLVMVEQQQQQEKQHEAAAPSSPSTSGALILSVLSSATTTTASS